MNIIENLNENQAAAVLNTEGPLLILAGAGSGKTRVITHRIANLVQKGVRPYNIFAVTFTNKAAEEMKNRIINIIGPEGNSVFAKTFHSAAVFILRRYGVRIKIPQSFSIYDQSDQETVIKQILIGMRLDPKKIRPGMIASKISEIKDKAALVEGADISQYIPDYFGFNFQEVYDQYHEKLEQQNALDFNDLLIKTVILLRESSEVLRELQQRWKYFMVDEYQDTNYAQYLITKYLCSDSRNICVVGDDDQSIYSWRGADIRNILDFEKDYDDAEVITLEENYRSTEQILKTAASIIRNNVNRKKKKLKTVKEDGELAVWCETNNEYGEAEYVVNNIITLKHQENLKNKNFAIFYRTNAQSRLFEDQLRKENIPYRVIGGLKFYDRKEIKDILAYLKFIVNPLDLVSMLRTINTPARGIGKATVDKIRDVSLNENITEWQVLRDDLLTGKVPKGIGEFKKIIIDAQKVLDDIPVKLKLSKFVSAVIDSSGYKDKLEEENSIESNSRLENIEEFINSVYDFEQFNPEGKLEEFLQEISLVTSEQNPDDENIDEAGNVVTLMTVHNAKGLEFPVVYLTGMEENTFPHKFSIDTEEGIEEERRLCYVGITRAMDRVTLTSAELRRSFAGVDYKEPSRFIAEIPEFLLEKKKYNSVSGASGGFSKKGYGNYSNTSYKNYKKSSVKEDSANPFKKDGPGAGSRNINSDFSIRERVSHPKYGVGLVVKIEGTGDNVKLTIKFGSSTKSFLEKYTPLEKVN